MTDLSVITVTHQSALFIEDQIFSVNSGSSKLNVEQIVIDNASVDGTVEVLDRLSHLLAKVIKNRENIGFARANNQGLPFAKGRYLLFLNPDMQVKTGSFDLLVEWMDRHQKVGISSCQLVDVLGRPNSAVTLPKLYRELLWLLRLDFLCRKKENPEEMQVSMVKGAFMLVRKELIDKLGFAFDPRYFLLFEDTDLCREAKRLGYEIVQHQQIQCVDLNSRSFAIKSEKWIFSCFCRSQLQYFRKWEPWYCWIFIALCIPLGYLLRFSWRKKNV